MTDQQTITRDTPFLPEDDDYHRQGADPLNLETNWWAINIPERRIGAWIHSAYYPNSGKVRWRIFAWDPRGADPAHLAYYRNVEAEMTGDDIDMRDIVYPEGGYGLKMRKPLMDYELTYRDADRRFGFELEFVAAHPPHRFTPGEAPAVHNPHLDQLGRFTGTLTLDGEAIPVDCWSVRDRTWGPREGAHASSQKYADGHRPPRILHPGGARWREIERERGQGRIQYIFGHTDDRTGFLSFVRPQDGDARGRSPLNMGWLLKDGRFTRLDKAQSWMRNYRDPETGWSQHMEVMLVDEEGRTMEAEGHTVSHMCEYGNGSNALMRWDYDGKTGWGEDQDAWKVPHFTRMLEALRAAR